MNVLITGGAGFIGSHLVERCLNEGRKVTVVDDLSTGSMDNVAAFESHESFSLKVGSILNSSLIEEVVNDADLIFHLAAVVGLRLVVKHPVRTLETNAEGTDVVLRAAARHGKRVVLASSSEVYGKSTKLPFKEDADVVLGPPNRGRWGYACSKMLDEFLGFAYAAEQELPVTIVRFFNTVGPRQSGRYGMVLPSFLRQALLGLPLTIFGSGKQKRCFGYVGDVVEALMRIADSSNTIGEVINLGTDEEISILELAKLCKKITDSRSEMIHVSHEEVFGPRFDDVARRVPSLEKLERLIGFRPSTPIEVIVRNVAADIAGKLDGAVAA